MDRIVAITFIFIITGCTSAFNIEESLSSSSNFNLKVNAKTYNEIQLNWSAVELAESYTLAYRQNATPPSDCTQGTVINNISNTTTSYTISSLTENKYYSFRICANLKSKSFSSETGSVSTKTSRLVNLGTLYSEKTWGRYIANNGSDIFSATSETNCTSVDDGKQLYEKCIHSAEILKTELLQAPECSSLTIEDNLNAFDWTCAQTNCSGGTCDVTFYSTGLKDGKGLRDLITDTPTLGFKDLSVTIKQNSDTYALSEGTQIWDNSLAVAPSTALASLSIPDTIYVYHEDVSIERHIISAQNIALVTINDSTITGTDTSKNVFENDIVISEGVWLEINVTGGSHSVLLSFADKVQLRNSIIKNSNLGGLSISVANLVNINDLNIDSTTLGGGYCAYLGTTQRFIVKNVILNNCNGDGLYLASPNKDLIFDNINISNSTDSGIEIASGGSQTNLLLKNITSFSNNNGIVTYSNSSRFEAIETYNNSDNGIYVRGSNNILNNIVAYKNSGTGVYQYGNTRNKYFNIKTHFNNKGLNIQDSSGENVVHNVIGTNNFYDNVTNGNSPNNTFSRIISTHSNSTATGPDNNSTFLGLTAANNGGQNFRIYNTSGATTVNMLNTTSGASYGTWIEAAGATNNYFAQTLLYNARIRVGSENNRFLDHLLIESPLNDCVVDATLTTPGLLDETCTTNGTDGSFGYSAAGPNSDAVLRPGIDITSSLKWLTTADDTTNTSDVNGVRAFDEITDWANFDSFYKAWGKSGASFPTTPGQCQTGQNCQIWDYRVLASDTVARNTTNDGKNQNQDFLPGMACPSAVDGERYIDDQQNFVAVSGDIGVEISEGIGNDDGNCEVGENCHNRFLINAFEIVLDGIGDDDGLCESNEACIYMPNYGAYQGEGDYEAQGTCQFQNGTISGVSMYAFPTNGIN